MDIIFIKQLSVFTRIGVYEWEKTIKQKLLLDIKIKCDIQQSAKSDKVKYCLDYAKISQAIIKYIETRKFELIERVAQEVSNMILNQFNTCWVQVKVSKPEAVLHAKEVGVIIERTKSSLR
ncbi:MAG: dihydroneopterin aldolase [Arsenophonus sp.]